jgi:hypothetical protein
MTFEQFQTTRTESTDLGADLEDASLENVPGYLYADGTLCIEISGIPDCTFRLVLDRDIYESGDLPVLELKLYGFAQAEGLV